MTEANQMAPYGRRPGNFSCWINSSQQTGAIHPSGHQPSGGRAVQSQHSACSAPRAKVTPDESRSDRSRADRDGVPGPRSANDGLPVLARGDVRSGQVVSWAYIASVSQEHSVLQAPR